jgi:hypothetical protein
MLSGILRSVSAAESHIGDIGDVTHRKPNKDHPKSYTISREETRNPRFPMTWTPPKRPISIVNVPLSPTPTDLNEPLFENPDLELKWNIPTWLGDDIINHPYRSRIPVTTGGSADPFTATNQVEVCETRAQKLLHPLSIGHNPEEFVYSPYGRIDVEPQLTTEQQQQLAVRRIDTEESTMGFISEECDRYPILLGGLYEPIIQGRFPDESDVRRAFVFRVQRWGANPGLHLHRLPGRELLLPDDGLGIPDETLKKRHKTWYFTYRVWYRFVNTVGPARFPGLLDQSWKLILESPPEEARTKFSEALHQYAGYAGTGPRSGGTELRTVIPDLLLSFDHAVLSPWPCQKPLTDLIIDLDEFESQRALEVRDSTRLWRGVVWNTFPKHCMKHIRVSSVGGLDSRWAVVHAEFSERLEKRRELWEATGKYRFPQGSYLPDATTSRSFDREQRLRQLIHESTVFASILLGWKDGALHLKHTVIPHLVSLAKEAAPLDDHHLNQWSDLCQPVQQFYEWKCGLDVPQNSCKQWNYNLDISYELS